jgi:hypothetical protein
LLAALAAASLWGSVSANPALAQQAGYGQTIGPSQQDGNSLPERDPFDTRPGGGGGSLFDATNPLELMNRIRRGTALDDATPPSSAVDQALRELEAQPTPSAPATPASGATLMMQGP